MATSSSGGGLCGAAERGCEMEPNDDVQNANVFGDVAADNTVRGFIDPAGDVDFFHYSVPGSGPARITIRTNTGPLGTGCSALDSHLSAQDEQGNIIAESDDINLPGGNRCSQVEVVTDGGSNFYIVLRRSPVSSNPEAVFDYTLEVEVTHSVCGNGGAPEPGEQCDDGERVDGDGCSAACLVEACPPGASNCETEPNHDVASADDFAALQVDQVVYGGVFPANEEDWYVFTLPGDGVVSIMVEDGAVGPGCGHPEMDSLLDLWSAAGGLLASHDDVDDAGGNLCSVLVGQALAAGTYYVRVTSARRMEPEGTFTYALRLVPYVFECGNTVVDPGEACDGTPGCGVNCQLLCGNGVLEPCEECDGAADCDAACRLLSVCGDASLDASEQCDDGNTADGDGCSRNCKVEAVEAEPNNTAAEPDPWGFTFGVAMVTGTIHVAVEHDVFPVTVPAGATLTAETLDGTTSTCTAQLDSVIDILGPDGVTVLVTNDDKVRGNRCSLASVSNLPAAVYFVRLRAFLAFNYTLRIAVEYPQCGTGMEEPGEGG